MTTPTGTIQASDVNVELGRGAGVGFSLGDSAVRTLAGNGGGYIDFNSLRGKSSYTPMTASVIHGDSTGSANGTTQYTTYCYPQVYPVNGTGSYTYSWSFTAQNGASISGGTGTLQQAQVGHLVSKFGYMGTSTLQCVISDGVGSITVSGIDCTWDWEYA